MHQLELQQVIFDLLDGVNGIGDVWDSVHQGSEFPYTVIGEATTNQADDDCHFRGDHTVTIHTFSQEHGRREVKEMQRIIFYKLHTASRNPDPVGLRLNGIFSEFQTTMLESDGKTRHGVQRFRVLTREVSP